MKKFVVIHVKVTDFQLDEILGFLSLDEIPFTHMEVGQDEGDELPIKPSTPFNNQMIGQVADHFGLTLCYIQHWLECNEVTSVEDAIGKTTIFGMAEYLTENFLS